jgi:NADP-dependent 3-hydroxy acid dehydrogenase YdfG
MPAPQPRTWLVTGASSGIGEATARAAAEAGDRVVLCGRDRERLDALVDELGADHVAAARGDVTRPEDQIAAVQLAIDRFGGLDVAFANAGVSGVRGFLNDSVERWRELVLTNVLGVALTIRATLPALRASRGHLLLTGGVAGRLPVPGSLYAATKAAVISLGEGARAELEGSGVRVTLVEPGTVHTAFYDNPQADALWPQDVARAVLYAVQSPSHVDVGEIVVRPTAERF